MNRTSETELLYQKVARYLDDKIRTGVYRAGDRLPSIRKLCKQERISVSSVMHGLALLESRGLIEARPKSGYFVRYRKLDSAPRPTPPVRNVPEPQLVGVSDTVASVFRQFGNERKVPLGTAIPSSTLLPLDRLSRLMAQVVREDPGILGRYGDPCGHPEFIRQLVRRFASFGCHIASEEIVATTGAMESLNLAIRAICKPGDTIAVEAPCYFGILEILESLGIKALPIPCHCEHGMDIQLLAQAIEKHPVKAVVLVPTFSNPSGSCMPESARKQLLALMEEYDLPIIEDDLYGDLQFRGERVRPIKSFDTEGRVLYCGSFSKSLTPGVRVGWIAAGRYTERVKRLKFISTLTSPMVNQLAVARFLDNGYMDRHLRALRQSLYTQMNQIAETTLESFPLGTAISYPQGGYFLWVQLPDGVDALELYQAADNEGIHIQMHDSVRKSRQSLVCVAYVMTLNEAEIENSKNTDRVG